MTPSILFKLMVMELSKRWNRRRRRSISKAMMLVAAAVVFASFSAEAFTIDSKKQEISNREESTAADSLGLAAVLIAGQDYGRALAALDAIDLAAAGKSFDQGRYFTLRGLAALMERKFVVATPSLRRAIARATTSQERARLQVALAKALAGQTKWRDSLFALDQAEEAGRAEASLFLLRANAHRQLGEVGRSLRSFRVGAKHFPSDRRLAMGESFLLVESGLIQEAVTSAKAWWSDASEDESLRLAAAVLAAGEPGVATKLGEEVLLRFPSSEKARVLLAHAAAQAGAFTTAAHHFEAAAQRSDDATASTIADAAEMYRRANRPTVALRLGMRIADPKRKARQRVGIYLEQERFAEAAAMQPRLERLGLIDDDMRLALAYAWLTQAASVTERDLPLSRATTLLSGVESSAAFRQAVSMREAIEACRKESSRCP